MCTLNRGVNNLSVRRFGNGGLCLSNSSYVLYVTAAPGGHLVQGILTLRYTPHIEKLLNAGAEMPFFVSSLPAAVNKALGLLGVVNKILGF